MSSWLQRLGFTHPAAPSVERPIALDALTPQESTAVSFTCDPDFLNQFDRIPQGRAQRFLLMTDRFKRPGRESMLVTHGGDMIAVLDAELFSSPFRTLMRGTGECAEVTGIRAGAQVVLTIPGPTTSRTLLARVAEGPTRTDNGTH